MNVLWETGVKWLNSYCHLFLQILQSNGKDENEQELCRDVFGTLPTLLNMPTVYQGANGYVKISGYCC